MTALPVNMRPPFVSLDTSFGFSLQQWSSFRNCRLAWHTQLFGLPQPLDRRCFRLNILEYPFQLSIGVNVKDSTSSHVLPVLFCNVTSHILVRSPNSFRPDDYPTKPFQLEFPSFRSFIGHSHAMRSLLFTVNKAFTFCEFPTAFAIDIQSYSCRQPWGT